LEKIRFESSTTSLEKKGEPVSGKLTDKKPVEYKNGKKPPGITVLSCGFCAKLKELTLPATLERVYARGCTALKEVTFTPDKEGKFMLKELYLYSCPFVQTIFLPPSLQALGLSWNDTLDKTRLRIPGTLQTLFCTDCSGHIGVSLSTRTEVCCGQCISRPRMPY
jgi:hypothetical protein